MPYLRLFIALAALASSPTCTCDEPDPVTQPTAVVPTEPVAVARAPEPPERPSTSVNAPEPALEPQAAEPTAEPALAAQPALATERAPKPQPVSKPAPVPAPQPAPEAEPVVEPEVEFAWHRPADGVFTPFAEIQVTGEARPGTWLKIRNGPEVEVTGTTFSIPLTLEEGTNRIHLIVTEIGRRTIQHRRKVTFVDLDRIQRIRERINAQRKTVEELEQIRADLVATIADIRSVLPSLPPDLAGEVGRLVDELDTELGSLGEASQGLDGELDRELAHIDDFKGRVEGLTD